MHELYDDPQQLGPALAQAREKLERFEEDVQVKNVMLRLRAHRPLHPFLIVRFLSLAAAAVCAVGGVAVATVPLLTRDLAQQVARLDALFSYPLPVIAGLLAAGFLLFALGAHLAALVAARAAPFLPHEAREHQRLVSDVKRLEAQLAVSARITPSPADRRAHPW